MISEHEGRSGNLKNMFFLSSSTKEQNNRIRSWFRIIVYIYNDCMFIFTFCLQVEETDQDCFEVDSAGRRLPQQQIVQQHPQQQQHHHHQHQPPQQIHIQHQAQPQMMQGDYEIVQFVQTNPNATVTNATTDTGQENQE